MPAVKALFWHFTWNNYDKAELDSLRTRLSQEETVRYACFGKEIGEGGTPHLQGYVAFKKQKTLLQCKAQISTAAHVVPCKGTEEQNIAYCSKQCTDDNPFEEFGTRKRQSGKRTDLEPFMADVQAGELDRKVLLLRYPYIAAQYPRFFDRFISVHRPIPEPPAYPYRPWQQKISDILSVDPSPRLIQFVVDFKGNAGKSWFCDDYCWKHHDAFVIEFGKKADMAFTLPDTLRVLFVDVTREQIEHLNYSFLESCKNGRVFSPKYESHVKRYPPMHVVVMMNQDPEMSKLSVDRYDIHYT